MTSSCTPGYRYLSYNFGDALELEDITWNGKPGFGAVQLLDSIREVANLVPRPSHHPVFLSLAVCKNGGTYCKQSKTGAGEGLGMRLALCRSVMTPIVFGNCCSGCV